jgi:hypothetical protein
MNTGRRKEKKNGVTVSVKKLQAEKKVYVVNETAITVI